MNGDQAGVLLAGLAGFALGGILADAVTRIAQVVIAMGTIGGFLGGAIGALLREDVTATAAIGGGIGVVLGTMLVLVDALVGG